MNKNSKSYRKVPSEVFAQICIFHDECGYGIAKLQDQFPHIHKENIYRHIKKPIGTTEENQL